MLDAGFPCVLASDEQPRIQYLRFHLGAKSTMYVLEDEDMKGMLEPSHRAILTAFLSQLTVLGPKAAPERKHVVLGQFYLEHVIYCQAGPIALMMKSPFGGNLCHYFGVYRSIVKPKIEAFEGFHELKDDDHDTETDEEDRPVTWDDDDRDDDIGENSR